MHTNRGQIRGRWRRAGAGLVALLAVLAPGCGMFSSSEDRRVIADSQPGSGPLEPIESRIDAVTGLTLIVPVRSADSESDRPIRPGIVQVGLDDGRPLTSVLRWITVGPEDPSSGLPAAPSRWLPPAGRWRTLDQPPSSAGLTMLVLAVDIPDDAAGHDLVIGPRRIRTNWLPSPLVLASSPDANLEPAIPRSLRESRSVQELTVSERLSPVRRWRYRLLTTGLHPAADVPVPAGEPRRFADPVLEALAAQYEARWAVGLSTLARTDKALARELSARICAVATFFGGTVAPVWPASQSDLDSLLADLLDPGIGPDVRTARVRVWLDAQPAAHAWVIDDAAERDDAGNLPVMWLGMLNLGSRPTLASASWLDPREHEIGPRPELVPIGPAAAIQMPLAIPRDAVREDRIPGESPETTAILAMHAGELEQRLRIDISTIRAQPPSLAIGPLAPDLTLETFLGPHGRAVERGWSTAAVLYRERSDDRLAAGSAVRWTLYVQCDHPAGSASSDASAIMTDALRLHFGGRSEPRMVLRIEETGASSREDDPSGSSFQAEVRTIREQTRWIAIVTVPAGCLERDGTLRLGIDRTDSRGVRSAWPRALLPWQLSPAHAVVDLKAWDR